MDQNVMKMINDLRVLRKDMGLFAEMYSPDAACWKGEAALEESCYISADIDDFNDLADRIEKELLEA